MHPEMCRANAAEEGSREDRVGGCRRRPEIVSSTYCPSFLCGNGQSQALEQWVDTQMKLGCSELPAEDEKQKD